MATKKTTTKKTTSSSSGKATVSSAGLSSSQQRTIQSILNSNPAAAKAYSSALSGASSSSSSKSSAPSSSSSSSSKTASSSSGGKVIGTYKGNNIYAGSDADVASQMRAIDGGGSGGTQPDQTQPGTQTPETTPKFKSTGVPQLDELLSETQNYLDGVLASGKKVNPNVELTPSMLQSFIDQAEKEMDPYYSSQISAIKGDLIKNVENLQKTYEQQKKDTGEQFAADINQSRETAADTGVVFSGGRVKQERTTQDVYNRNLEQRALSLEGSLGTQLRGVETSIGSRNLDTLGIPQFTAGQVSAADPALSRVPGTGRSLSFQRTGGVAGSLENEKTTSIRTRANQLEQAERARRSLNLYN